MKKEVDDARRAQASEMRHDDLVNAFVALGAERDALSRQTESDRKQIVKLYAVIRACRDRAKEAKSAMMSLPEMAKDQILAIIQEAKRALGDGPPEPEAPFSDLLNPSFDKVSAAQEAMLAEWVASRGEVLGALKSRAFGKTRSGDVSRLLASVRRFIEIDVEREQCFRSMMVLVREGVEGVRKIAGQAMSMNAVLAAVRKPNGLPLAATGADGIREVLEMGRVTREELDQKLGQILTLQSENTGLVDQITETRALLDDMKAERRHLRELLAIYLHGL